MAGLFDGLPGHVADALQKAGEALDAGRPDVASRVLEASTAPADHPEVLRLRAGVLGMQGRHSEALALMHRAVAMRPRVPAYRNTLGTLLGQAGQYDAAVQELTRACELSQGQAMPWYNLGVMLTRSVRNDEAVQALERAVELEPAHMPARALLADLWRMQGRAAEADAAYRAVLARQPWSGMAWWGLADLRTARFSRSDIEAMERARTDPRATLDERMATGFALAHAYEEADSAADALAALAQANALARQRQQWDAAAFSAGAAAVREALTPTPANAREDLGNEVVFIVGLPRSGSTLVEQILASHSRVEGAGELADLPQVLAEESRRRGMPFPRWVASMQPEDWARLGERYLERTARWRTRRPLSTDKLPSNWIYLGAIRAMLPGARIVGCLRDPLETCLSCYRQRMENNEYTRTFGDLAAFYRDYVTSLAHWAGLAPGRVLRHQHEALVEAPEAQVRRLLEFCGLPFEEACLRFHETEREVRSPSATQVRQPLRDTARAARYGRLLDPLRDALARALAAPPS